MSLVWVWRMAVQQSLAATTELAEVEMEWSSVSAQLEEAEKTRPQIQQQLDLPKRLAEERDAPRWTPALRCIVASVGPEIELRLITARGVTTKPGAFKLSIQGSSIGPSRLEGAERFRQALQTALDQQSGGLVTVRIEELDDESTAPTSLPEEQKASFFISATVGRRESAGKNERKK
jgi:hypothetical protein